MPCRSLARLEAPPVNEERVRLPQPDLQQRLEPWAIIIFGMRERDKKA